ncbi:Uncharacterised protein [Cedecea davisae]|nr:Uncharacterised protein [Cedecea davisae]
MRAGDKGVAFDFNATWSFRVAAGLKRGTCSGLNHLQIVINGCKQKRYLCGHCYVPFTGESIFSARPENGERVRGKYAIPPDHPRRPASSSPLKR